MTYSVKFYFGASQMKLMRTFETEAEAAKFHRDLYKASETTKIKLIIGNVKQIEDGQSLPESYWVIH